MIKLTKTQQKLTWQIIWKYRAKKTKKTKRESNKIHMKLTLDKKTEKQQHTWQNCYHMTLHDFFLYAYWVKRAGTIPSKHWDGKLQRTRVLKETGWK